MKDTTYLYECKPSEFIDLPYKDAIEFKYQKAKKLYAKLEAEINENYAKGEPYKNLHDLRNRFHQVHKAMAHNYNLITEMEWENG
jgi:hypothetical protein